MSRYHLVQDQKKCIGCQSCEVHCKSYHALGTGLRINRILPIGPEMAGTVPRMTFAYFHCFHCEDPWCVPVCPTEAMRKRPEDGIVYVEQSECIGCLACVEACPWGVPQLNAETGTVTKCDYCMERVDQGLKPACVLKCVTHCLHFGKEDELRDLKGDRYMEALPFELAPSS